MCLSSRRAEEGVFVHPLRFLTHLFIGTSFPHMLQKFQTQVTQGQVTSSRQVTSPQKSLNARHSYTDWPITLILSAINSRNSIFVNVYRKFDIGDPRLGQFCDRHYVIGKKIKRRPFWTKTIRNTLEDRVTGRIDTLNRNMSTSAPPHVAEVA